MIPRLTQSLLASAANVGADPADHEDLRLRKSLLVISSLLVLPAGGLWGAIYLAYREWVPALIPLVYTLISGLSVLWFANTRRYDAFRISQLALVLLLPFLLQMTLGGFVSASTVFLWSLLCPIGALLFAEPPEARRWLAAYLALLATAWMLQPLVQRPNNLPPAVVMAFFAMNIGAISTIVFVLLHHFVTQKDQVLALLRAEQARSENLLLNILPKEIAAILKVDDRTIADHYEGASILFADMVGFTPLSASMKPAEMVELLNEVFSAFDWLVEKYDLEKIRTIGDSYMVASGVPRLRPDHAQALARMALEMRDYVLTNPACLRHGLGFRIGLNSGPVVAGVIGRKKFIYDLWGDAVNTASRMESHGVPGQIQITRASYELLADEFICQPRGTIVVKGKGEMETWYLVGYRGAL